MNALAKPSSASTLIQTLRRLYKSVWFFPLLLLIPLIILSSLRISGSSIGIYHKFLYGNAKDSNLIIGQPRSIRSDEWLVSTQTALAQKNNGFGRINTNIGDGEDVSLLGDAPYKEWSTIFKPHNWAFFVLPFENAFAFRWWLLAYLLIISCYFFCLSLLPGKRLLGSLLGAALLFSPFVQWWYLVGTLSVLYLSLFIGAAAIKLLRGTKWRSNLWWGLLLAYLLTCFAMMLYPPFQIACAIVTAVFGLGYLLESLGKDKKKLIWQKLSIMAAAVLLAGALTGLFLTTRQSVVQATENTAYPGQRVQLSGGYDVAHLFSSHLATQFQSDVRARHYEIVDKGITNQSEAANFILLLPFLFLPALVLLISGYRKNHKIDWPLLSTSGLFVLILIRLFLPVLNTPFNLLQLGKVPHSRLLIGLGLLSVIHTILFIRNLAGWKQFPTPKVLLLAYCLAVFGVSLYLGFYAHQRAPQFIGYPKIWLLSLPIPVVIYLLMAKRFALAALGLLAFSVFSTVSVNPLYKGLEVVTKTPLSQRVRAVAAANNGKWAAEGLVFENFGPLNGAASLTGVYQYPQHSLWEPIGSGSQKDIYNRYAHTILSVDRNPLVDVVTSLQLGSSSDLFLVTTESCSSFLQQRNVRFFITQNKLSTQDSCAKLIDTVTYPSATFYLYQLTPTVP